jgi:hypothetical protein
MCLSYFHIEEQMKEKEGVLTEVFYCTKNCNLHYHSGYDTGCGYTKDCRIATAEEKQLFFNALAKEGKTWNPQTKQIEDIKKEYEFHLKDWCLMRCENGRAMDTMPV